MVSKGTRWFTLESATAPESSGFALGHDPKGAPGTFAVVADYAGRYERLELSVGFADPLGLFRREERVKPQNFTVEVLPLSILASPSRSMLFALTSGETPIGSRGSGQEFYGIEQYGGAIDSKDILWRRVAKTSDEAIVSRVREANVPHSLRVCLIEGADGDKTVWMDTVTEGLGRIGMTLIRLGMALEVTVQTRDGVVSQVATTIDGLVELVVGVWKERGVPEAVGDAAMDADVVIVSSGAMKNQEVYSLSESKSTLIVLDAGRPVALGARSRILTDDLGLEGFLSWAVVR